MPKITFVGPDGSAFSHALEAGQSLMRAALDNDVPGIVAECGGACACATCQILIPPEWLDRIPAPEAVERSMLDDASAERGMTRRLSCQIMATAELDGLVVHIPSSQY